MICMVLDALSEKKKKIVEVCLPVVGLFISNTRLIDEVLIQDVPFLISAEIFSEPRISKSSYFDKYTI